MRTWAEGALAVLVVLSFGVAFSMATGNSLLDGPTGTTAAIVTAEPEAAARGAVVAQGIGCLQCHSVDGSPGSGPTWQGMAGSERRLASGETVIADDEYLRASIVEPSLQILADFPDVMPKDYSEQLTSEEINDLVEYMKSLSG